MEKQTIYEIFRACRLCGSGGGYKMPIIQNLIDMDEDKPLKDKIRECVNIEVQQNDKMPPLICEHCVDKVNDFHHFLELCQGTNKRTRQRLGLPTQSKDSDTGDCILGLTEPVYVKPEGKPLGKNQKLQKGPQLKMALKSSGPKSQIGPKSHIGPKSKTMRNTAESRELKSLKIEVETRSRRGEPRVSRQREPAAPIEKESVQSASKSGALLDAPKLRGILKRNDTTVIEPDPQPPRGRRRPAPAATDATLKKAKASPPRAALAAPRSAPHRTAHSDPGHYETHKLKTLNPKPDLVRDKDECTAKKKCYICGKVFKVGLRRHERRCAARHSKSDNTHSVVIPAVVRKRLLHMEVLVARCDPLVGDAAERTRYYRGSEIYGLDKKRTYPYAPARRPAQIKQEPLQDGMVSITEDILDFGGWDSEYSSEGSVEESILSRLRIDSLSNLSLKAVRKSLGKKKGKAEIKDEFDHANEGNDMLSNNISDIINNTTWDDDDDDKEVIKSDEVTVPEINVLEFNIGTIVEGIVERNISNVVASVVDQEKVVSENGPDASNSLNDKVPTDNMDVSNENNESEGSNGWKCKDYVSDLTSDKEANDETNVHEVNELNDYADAKYVDKVFEKGTDKNENANLANVEKDVDTILRTNLNYLGTSKNESCITSDILKSENELVTSDHTHLDDANASKMNNVQNNDDVRRENDEQINGVSDVSKSYIEKTSDIDNEDVNDRINPIENNETDLKTNSGETTNDSNAKQEHDTKSDSEIDQRENETVASEGKTNGVNVEGHESKSEHLKENKQNEDAMSDEQLMRDLNEQIGNSNSSDKNQFSHLQDISDEEFNFDV